MAELRIMEMDRISNLPGNVMDQILVHLPFKEAARTTVLSKDWKCKFSELPFITINDDDFRSIAPAEFVAVVDRVLDLHPVPIQKFKISIKLKISMKLKTYKALGRWIAHLSRNNAKEFELELDDYYYRLPLSFFSWQSLTSFVFCKIFLRIPPSFTGFANLRSIKLQEAAMEQTEFEILISSCPVLKRVWIEGNCLPFESVRITAPNLEFLHLDSTCEGISFTNSPRLSEVFLHFFVGPKGDKKQYSRNLVKFIVSLPTTRRLDIDNYVLEYLVPGINWTELLISFDSLESLSLSLCLNSWEDCLRVHYFFKFLPNLTKLRILTYETSTSGPEEGYDWESDRFNFGFTRLQFVEIIGSNFSGTKTELGFVKFILSNSPVLEKIVIKPLEMIHESLLMDFSGLERASTTASIVFGVKALQFVTIHC